MKEAVEVTSQGINPNEIIVENPTIELITKQETTGGNLKEVPDGPCGPTCRPPAPCGPSCRP